MISQCLHYHVLAATCNEESIYDSSYPAHSGSLVGFLSNFMDSPAIPMTNAARESSYQNVLVELSLNWTHLLKLKSTQMGLSFIYQGVKQIRRCQTTSSCTEYNV